MTGGAAFTMARLLWAALVIGVLLCPGVQGRILVDMTGPGCHQTDDRMITDEQIYTLYARYKFNSQPTIDHCDVTLRATERNRRLRYLVEDLNIFDCGTTIWIFDDPNNFNKPTRTLECQDSKSIPIKGTTAGGTVKFSLRKESSQSSAFTFQIQITTDFGPDIEFERKDSEFYEAPLDAGTIVGIAIAGVILIIALVGLAIYCCLKNRMDMKYAEHEASAGRSAPSVFTSGTSQGMYPPAYNQRKGGGGKYGSMEDVRSSNSSTDKANNFYSNKGYEAADGDEKRFNRQDSYRREKRGGNQNAAFVDEADASHVRGGHVSRRDSGRSAAHAKYDKKKNYSRHEEYEMSKVSKAPNGILKTRSRSPNRSHSSTDGSTVDSNALIYGYGHTTHAHPNTQHIPVLERTRSRSRSRGTASRRSGSAGRSRSGSVGKSSGRDMKPPPDKAGARQYNDLRGFLDQPKQRPRSRSGSMGRRSRSDSKTSEHVPSEVSFAPSGNSSKKNTGGKRVHIQSVESDI